MTSILSIFWYFALLVLPKADLVPPPGTVKIGENRFIDKRLITHEAYYEYLYWLKRNEDAETYLNMIPKDTTVRYKGKTMWRSDAFLGYPIAGLDRAQVQAYCAWRSYAVNLMKANPGERTCNFDYWKQFDDADPANAFRITYTLPEDDDLKAYKAGKEPYWLQEYTTTGDFNRKPSKKISNTTLRVFRCLAVYEANP